MGATGLAKWRPAVWAREPRVYCLRCAWSIEGWNRYAGGVREHLDGHPGAGLSLGQDYALGHRYGPGTGAPRWRCGRPGTTRQSKRSGNAAGGAAVEPG